ncbi:dihydrolipoyllysine-residue acetyltransferase component 2 of pyruvate dehydrogenase complex, mitochondrial-like, partial [Triticum dicoccoides]|uniref:dihydrolipoyllysine-residue acetyltransferase component 2 of pyruvate dehydrogenase complex, mitochondrial-like n=1 Tax=Triticum dicoccoides TaxID=85692 RepID=UPI00189131E6
FQVTANRLLASKQTIPHYYLTVDTRVDKLIKLRGELNPLQEASGGKKISINDLVIKAAALALRKVPECNSSWMNDFIRQYHNVNINVAVQTEHGLFVPVVRDADKKGLGTIGEEVKQLAQRARDNSLKPQDYKGGTFTVSNLGGPFGIKQFCAIINPPQSAILAIGSAEKRVIPGSADGQYEFGSYMSVTMSCDHRVIDGAIGAEFLKAFKGYIENPRTRPSCFNSYSFQVTANRLLASKQTIPHYYLTVDTRVDKLIKLRGELNPLQEASGGKKISINDLVIKAAALALRKVPECNSSWMNDFIRQYHNVNINVVVQTEHGLFVPVVRDADKKGLGTIGEEVKQLAQRARDNSLKPQDYEGGTFTVSNLGGPFGIKQFCAIINPPQSAILAIGSAEKRVIPGSADGQYEFGSYMSVTMSCDHRVIDCAIGAEFLKAFKGYIENPTQLRGELNPLQEASGGKKISINDLVIKAAALALRKVPECNSSWMNDFIRQ